MGKNNKRQTIMTGLFWASLLDKTKLSLVGIARVLKKWQYLLLAFVLALVFGIIFSLTATGTTDWNMLFSALPLVDKLDIIGRSFISLFKNASTFSGFVILLVVFLQGVTIALLVYNMKQQRKMKKLRDARSASASEPALAAVIATLGLGCSTCGTSLLLPLFGALAGSALFLSTLTIVIAIVAIGLLLHSSWRMGYSAYMFTSTEGMKGEK